MPRRKKSDNDTHIQEMEDTEYVLLKHFIRAGVQGMVTDGIILHQINHGFLGFEVNEDGTPKMEKKNVDGKEVSEIKYRTISKRTYYRYKKDATSINAIQQDFVDFVKIDYAIQISGVRSMLQICINTMYKGMLLEPDPIKKGRLAHALFVDLPSFTQFLDIEKKAIQHGKISLKDKNEERRLASSN